ncbi:MAG: M48 family metallopeptidase [Solirubrobacterales bacterium]
MATPSAALYNTDFQHSIARNKRNTVLLFVVLLAIAAVLGYVLGWGIAILNDIWSLPSEVVQRMTVWSVLRDLFGPPRPEALQGAVLVSGAGLIWGLVTLFAGAHILAAFAGARPANPENASERRFIDVVEEMAIAAGVPPPRAMVVETPALNAFASGYSPARAMITATTGILEACTREELQGVVGHEMGHVADYDVRYTTVVAAMAGVIVLVAHLLGDIARWSFGWGGPGRFRGGGKSDGAGAVRLALTLVVLVLLAVTLIAAPLAARLVQMAISRQREYLADASSAKLTRNPVGLIHALERLAQSDTALARKDSPVAALCIAEPKDKSLAGLFSTHPPIPERIARLRNLGGIASAPERGSVPEAGAATAADAAPPADEAPHKGPWG